MYRIKLQHGRMEGYSYVVDNKVAMQDALILAMSGAVAHNKGFIYLEDTGAAFPAIKYNDGSWLYVERMQ